MKRYFGLLALCALAAGPAAAAPGHSGAWHSVEAKSYWSDGQFPKGFSLEIDVTFSDNKVVYHSANDTDKTKVGGLDFTTTLDGKPSPVEHQARFNQISVKQLGPDQLEILEMKDGDVVVGAVWIFSKDGKSFSRWGVGKSPDGKSKAFNEYFQRMK
jgi:hypothetical protein